MATNTIPEMINNFNVYNAGNALIGLSDEVALAELSALTETLSGPGVLGEIEVNAIGHFGSMEQEIPFRILEEDIFSLANPLETLELTLRASEQSTVKSTGNISFKGMRVVFRGKVKNFVPGKVKAGTQMGASVTLEVHYILIEIDGARKLELDKLNEVYKVNDVDLLAEVKKYI